VADTGNNRLQKFTFGGAFIKRLGRNGGDSTAGGGPGQFSTPYGVAVDCRGDLYVSDEGNERIQVLGEAAAPPPVCPPLLRLGQLSSRARNGTLSVTASCDQPCTLTIRTRVSDAGVVRRTLVHAELGMGVSRMRLRIPLAVPKSSHAGEPITVRVSVQPVGFAGPGRPVTRRALASTS
jgi:hypothetical protein